QLASLRSRTFACIIDDLIFTIIVMAIFWDRIMSVSHDTEAMIYLMQTELVTPLFILKIVYQTIFVWYYGATIDKIIEKIRVIVAKHRGRVSIFA
ncbi:RDD family protein, partial [Aliarcobacter butzleri]|uniref:RDD family protein n=1 Tax=Aliarcobacter butzleri TaxID=28197 RepID=UPI003AEA3ADC